MQVFSEVLMNILSNFVTHKQPLWMNPKISSPLRKHAKLNKLFYKNPSESIKEPLLSKSTECFNLILTVKENYEKKMTEILGLLILNNYLGKRKTFNIPFLIVNDFVILDFKTKAKLFNNFFASKCPPVVNSSTLPSFAHKTRKTNN